MANKYHAVEHSGRLQAGSLHAWNKMRWSVRGGCFDQGVERLLADPAHISNATGVSDAIDARRAGTQTALASRPDSFLWPLMVRVTGPLHQAWNGFESACKGSDGWDDHVALLSAVLDIHGHSDSRDRFLEQANLPFDEERMYDNFAFSVVDWKWEYMERVWSKMVEVFEHFMRHFDAELYQCSAGQ